jgi:hypothetical protein
MDDILLPLYRAGALPISPSLITACSTAMETVLPQSIKPGWSILTTIENFVGRNGPSVLQVPCFRYNVCFGVLN